MGDPTIRRQRLADIYSFLGFRAHDAVRDDADNPQVRVLPLVRRSKKRSVAAAGRCTGVGTTGACGVCARSLLRRLAHLPGDGGPARRMSELWPGETRAAVVPGRQPGLHQALCLLCRAALPTGHGQGHRRGTEARLGHGEVARHEVHAGQARQGGHAGPDGDRHRRDIDPQGTHVSHHR